MDEHDKRAREVLDANEGNIDVSFDGVAILASALRSTAAAAERRIAARLRARADEEERAGVDVDHPPPGVDLHANRRLASVLRSEADALEGT